MNKLKRISFDAFVTWLVIILMLLLDVQAQCTWSSALETDCKINCKSTNFEATERIMDYLEARFIEVVKNYFLFNLFLCHGLA